MVLGNLQTPKAESYSLTDHKLQENPQRGTNNANRPSKIASGSENDQWMKREGHSEEAPVQHSPIRTWLRMKENNCGEQVLEEASLAPVRHTGQPQFNQETGTRLHSIPAEALLSSLASKGCRRHLHPRQRHLWRLPEARELLGTL